MAMALFHIFSSSTPGLSGIWKGHDYNRGHFEAPPYSADTMRSAYHVRNLEVFRMKQISKPIDVVVTHDWPRGIYYHGNYEQLIRRKSFFQSEIEENTLGNPVFEDLLLEMRPAYWFAAHLHVKFAAIVDHESAAVKNRLTVLGKTAPTTFKGSRWAKNDQYIRTWVLCLFSMYFVA